MTTNIRIAQKPGQVDSRDYFFAARAPFSLLMFFVLFAGAVRAENLYVKESDDGLYGFASSSGDFVIPPEYDYADPFSEGLAAVYLDDEWGFIDAEGKLKIKPHFREVDRFSGGIAAVQEDSGTWEYIDAAGNLAPGFSGLNFQESGLNFQEGLAAAQPDQGGKYGFINRSGEYVIPPRFQAAEPFSEGLAPVSSDNRWGYIDKTGNYAIPPSFEEVMAFSEHLAAARSNKLWGYIDKSGNYVIPPSFEKVSAFSEGLAAVRSNKLWGYIDKSGNYAIPPSFEEVSACSEGLAAMRLSGRWGYIGKNGQTRIPIRFPRFAEPFVGGLAVVSDPVRGSAIYIDSAGRSRFLKSDQPRPTRLKGKGPGGLTFLELSSDPPGATVYLIPAFIWDQKDAAGRPPPSQLKDVELKNYLNEHFEFKVQEGQTNVQARILEENFVALFFLGNNMERVWVDVRQYDNKAAVSFHHH
jgi:hypothetical protein